MPFKKIFKPIAKVLDKVIPNEIKPALPYIAAFAPVFGPTAGMFGSTMAKRALLSGGANILGQLSQEGNEGDINLLSAGLGALTGAMTVPNKAIGVDKFGNEIMSRTAGSSNIFRNKAAEIGTDTLRGKGLEVLAKGSDMLAAGAADPFSKEGLMAATIPAATATGDLMFAEAKRNADEIAAMALEDLDAGASDADRANAIRLAMLQYGFSEDEIADTVASAGYKKGGRVGFANGGDDTYQMYLDDLEAGIISPDKTFNEYLDDIAPDPDYDKVYKKGGRVGLKFGGIGAAVDAVEDESIKESMKFASDIGEMDIPMMDLVEEFEIIFKRKPSSLDELKQFYRDFYEYKGPGENIRMKEKIKEKVVMEAKDGGLMNLGGKEMDMRGGGFIPIGSKERADDVPARLSKNEFVMTADAVRGAGGGNINKGAKRMYETMNKLEARA